MLKVLSFLKFSILSSFFLLSTHTNVFADVAIENVEAKPAAYKGWSSVLSYGFGGDNKSWISSDDMVMGSVLFLDVIKNFGDLAVGIRSMGTGGKLDGDEVYKMGSGPFVSYTLFDNYTAKLAGGYFSESASNSKGKETFSSTGTYAQLEWGRVFKIWDNFEIIWSAFFIKYWGSMHGGKVAMVKQKPVLDLKSNLKYEGIKRNEGTQTGMTVSIRIHLDK